LEPDFVPVDGVSTVTERGLLAVDPEGRIALRAERDLVGARPGGNGEKLRPQLVGVELELVLAEVRPDDRVFESASIRQNESLRLLGEWTPVPPTDGIGHVVLLPLSDDCSANSCVS